MLDIAAKKDVYKTLDQLELGQQDYYGTWPWTYKQKFEASDPATQDSHLSKLM